MMSPPSSFKQRMIDMLARSYFIAKLPVTDIESDDVAFQEGALAAQAADFDQLY